MDSPCSNPALHDLSRALAEESYKLYEPAAFPVGEKVYFHVSPLGAAAIALTALLGVCGAARAEEECGPPPSPGRSIICSSSNYDAVTEGNIVYHLANGDGDFVIRFVEDLSISYSSDDPDDDSLFYHPTADSGRRPLYSAVRIETDADYAGDISVFSSANVISDGRGISVFHHGKSGALNTEISGGSFSIESEWYYPHAIYSYRGDGRRTGEEFSGDHNLVVRNVVIDSNVSMDDESGGWSTGIGGVQNAEGDLSITVQDSAIKVNSRWATGVVAAHAGSEGDVDVNVQDVTISLSDEGDTIDGIYGFHLGRGNSTINVRDTDIEIRGTQYSNGIAYSYWGEDAAGDLSIDAQDVNIQVSGERYLDGIFGRYNGNTGAIDVDVHRADIVVTGADSGGIAFVHDSTGSINIGAREVDIKVEGDRSVGIGGGQRYEGTGDIAISVHDSMITVTGEQVAGIRSFNFSGEGTIDVNVDGGTVTAQGPGSSGILVGLTGRIFGDRMGPIVAPVGVQVSPADRSGNNALGGNRPQRVVVNGRVRGGGICDSCPGSDAPVVGAGVRMYGGGRVEIGPRGSVGADSGVAVSAEGEGAALHVAFNGRRPSEGITGEIRNDDGRTTITVNGVVLHDGMTGATGALAPNGARDVSLESSQNVKGRTFKLTDFKSSAYAPRAAVYETLPGFMLRLHQGAETTGPRLPLSGSPVWVKVSGGQGAYKPDRSQVGGTYDFNHFGAEAGLEFALSQQGNITGWAGLRHVKGSADVSAPTGGGTIEASGLGASAGLSWENTAGYYATGSVSLTRYEMDLHSNGRGTLKDDVDATVRSFGIEAGRRFSLSDRLFITPQAWWTHADLSMDDFQDDVGSRVSLGDAAQSMAGIGVLTETTHVWNQDQEQRTLHLRGWLGVEQGLGDGETVVEVSGERLGSEPARTRAVLGLGASYLWSRWSLDGEVAASALGSADNHYTASLRLGTQF